MKNFRTYHEAVALYRQVRAAKVPGHLRNQLERAASSIVLNLAEGWSKQSRKERRRFFEIALCSLRETQACLELAYADTCKRQADIVGAHCHKLVAAVSALDRR